MENKNPKNFPIVAVTWLDSMCSDSPGWEEIDIDDLKEKPLEPLECFTTGFLIFCDGNCTIICSSYFEKYDGVIGALGTISIPEESIIEFEWLWR